MAVTLFSFVALFGRQVATALHLLDKGAAHLTAAGADPEAMLDWRLADDMHPLRFQVEVVNKFAGQWPARVADLPLPPEAAPDLDIAGLRAALGETQAFLATLVPERFVGRDDVAITHLLGNGFEPTLTAGQWLSGFAMTNIQFHNAITYAILRGRGVPLGKADLFSGGL